ncbi:RIC1-domain-containing protein [Trichodelitschia bisporula]|uniref:RIC1-domain-containing protein n=1 Tax=Trichodelitschia bisporula TaxID=703511 RepID=A0A6G1I0B5_9PEZI|nr:RIC1-domain-containing protein [Trichodelitschia bisporula]
MYWPIGAPRIYAATRHQLSAAQSGEQPDETPVLVKAPPADADTNGTNTRDRDGGEDSEDGETRTSDELEDKGVGNGRKGGERDGAEEDPETALGGEIVGLRVARNGHIFATITRSTLTIWQTKPTAAVASLIRSASSVSSYGPNVNVLFRPDSAIVVVQTSLGFLITYSLATDPSALIYQPVYPESSSGHARHKSLSGHALRPGIDPHWGPGEGHGVREISIRFRMVIKIDAGVSQALALDEELVVATDKPAAIQCIRWSPNNTDSQTSTELVKSLPWIAKKGPVVQMVHDRPMNISAWITSDGRAYAVQRTFVSATPEAATKKSFKGYGFHVPESEGTAARQAAINARFSLIAVGCADGSIFVYSAKDYSGHIPLSHLLAPPSSSSNPGYLTFLSYSPDGYCLIAGYEHGWTSWSVYGKPGSSSFSSDRTIAETNDEKWILGIKDGFWIGGGSQLLLLSQNDNRLWVIDMARSAVTGCFSSANVARSLLQTNSGFMIYRGYDLPDMTAISSETGLWHHVEVPSTYLAHQWPIRSAIISKDGRYVAVAGRRGLAHYSVNSGRWKTFDDPAMESEFTVRGGMCWYQHVLIAAVESNEAFEIRVYSRESALDDSHVMHVEQLSAPIVLLSPSGEDSLLVYTYDNNLYHYIISVTNASVKLVRVGQIALHGIIRAPPRVRALSWILPEAQLDNGDPSQDVAIATIVFLVDGKLVLLQPTTKESGELRYDMRIIAQNVEYYALMREQPYFGYALRSDDDVQPYTSPDSAQPFREQQNDLRDSLWYFDGTNMRVWTDVQDVLSSASPEFSRELPVAVSVNVDFYPLSILLNKGILFGVESEMIQRRDISFAFLRFATRTHLFLPPILRHHLSQYNSPSALYLSHHYQHLPYFPHALEVLLHDVLDEEADTPPSPETALLPGVLSFLSSFPHFLDIVVQCTRKTEARSWQTLFAHLPPPSELFEEALARASLKTAGGYLLVLQDIDDLSADSSGRLLRLLKRAKDERDWELCRELARFLMSLDESGGMLREALEAVGLTGQSGLGQGDAGGLVARTEGLRIGNGVGLGIREGRSPARSPGRGSEAGSEDYFSLGGQGV